MGRHGVVAPQNNFLDAHCCVFDCFYSCSFQGLVLIGLLWIVFFLVFFWMEIYLVGCGEVATLQNNFFHLLEMCFFIF